MLASMGLVGCSTDLSKSPIGPSTQAAPPSSGSMTAASHEGSSHGGGGNSGPGHDAGDDDHGRAEGPEVEPNDAEVFGAVGGRIGTCPVLTFVVGTTKVTTNSATIFEDVACRALANGDQVEVNGTLQDGGTLLAARVEFRRTEHR